jgi:hypothetical protein
MLRSTSKIKNCSLLIFIGVFVILLSAGHSHALLYPPIEDFDGEGWSTTKDGVLTIESDQGWANFLKYGYRDRVNTLYLGKDVTTFRIYHLPNDIPTADFFKPEDVLWYDYDGEPYYGTFFIDGFYVTNIIVEEGSKTFRVSDGLLINTTNNSIVLSENNVTDVVIPEGIKTITFGAFFGRAITSIQFPTSMETIGDDAFSECKRLTSLYLPDSITQLGRAAFRGCEALKDVRFPNGIKRIGTNAFGFTGIEEVILPGSVEEIGSFAFNECSKLQRVILPNKLRTIDQQAFQYCEQLQSVDFPEGLEQIAFQSFNGCYNLRQVILPDSLIQIGDRAFGGCDLSLLRLPNELEFILYDEKSSEYKANPHATRDKAFGLSSVETVIFTGSDYDFGYHAITDAKDVYFLSTPPEEVGEFLDKETVENIYCSDEYEFQWTRSKVASWVRQKLTILPAAEINALVEEKLNTTPTPQETTAPTPSPTPGATPAPTPKLTPTPTLTPQMEQSEAGVDPLPIVFTGLLALVVAGIVVVVLKERKKAANHKRTKRKKDTMIRPL